MSKEPLMHIVKRDGVSFWRGALVRLIAVLLSLIVCAVVIVALTGMNPLSVYAGIWNGAMGTTRRMWVTLRDSAILLCIGFAVLPAFRMRFWNIGAEGQVLVGAMATAAVMIYGKDLPAWALHTLCPLAGVLAGLVWGVIPAFFKAHWNTNETLFTLMLNYIAMQLVSFAIVFWENPKGSNHVGLINSQSKAGWLPSIGTNGYLLPILIVLALMVILFVYMRYSKQGYEIAKKMLATLKLPDTKHVMNAYPFQLSGGMKQRVAIAMAMSMHPKLLLADEPTSALDVTVQAQVVKQMMDLRDKMGTAIVIVTHNMGVASKMADYIAVMQNGELKEFGTREQVIYHPENDYTKKLLTVVPKLQGETDGE